MSTYKNVNNDYTLTCNNGDGFFTINAQTLFNGNVTYTVPSVSTSAFITVAANNTGAITDAGLLTQTGPTTFAGIRFDSTLNVWQISSSVSSTGVGTYANIITATSSATPGGPDTAVQFNGNGSFAGSTTLLFDEANTALTLNGTEIFGNSSIPAYTGNGVAVYNNVMGQGGTGLYVKNSDVNQELVSKSKAIIFSLIF
jgi:hypothetical protein